jgi:signal transduction histidine kinase
MSSEIALATTIYGRVLTSSLVQQSTATTLPTADEYHVARAYVPGLGVLGFGMLLHYLSIRAVGHTIEATFFIYILAILIGAWYGYGPGLLIAFLVSAVLPFLFRPGFSLGQINLVALSCYACIAVVVTRITNAQRRAEHQLRALNADLERRVQEKTAELAQRLIEREALLTSEQRANAEAETANRLKDEFFAMVSHELRGPLQGILGYAHVLTTGQLAPEVVQNASTSIERNGRTLARLIDDMLDVSRIITDKLTLDIRATDLQRVAATALDNARPSATAKEITLHFDADPNSIVILADPNRLQQAMWNLLANSIKFTPPGGTVSVRIQRHEGVVQLTVQDNGIGISPDFLPHAFERLRQADVSTTRIHGGLGLGLFIVRHIIELHGGTVTALSDGPGTGATFTITLPVEAPPTTPRR